MSSTNFTQEQGLVTPITESSWFRRPAGREGYEVIVLEKVSTGNRYYTTLRPGETLRLGESVFGKFLAYAVDMRYGKSFPVEGQFATQERNRKITLKANVRYRVTDSRQVAVGAEDPLGELRDKVIDALNREIARYPHDSVHEGLCVEIIRGVGYQPHLGLGVEGAEIIEFSPEPRTLSYRTEEEELEHKLMIQQRAAQAEIEEAGLRERARMDLDEEKIQRFDLRDPNVFMHVRPDMVPAVLNMMSEREKLYLQSQQRGLEIMDQAIRAYIAQKQEEGKQYINLEEVADAVRTYLSPGLTSPAEPQAPRIDFGTIPPLLPSEQAPSEKRIEFGEEKDNEKRIQFGETGDEQAS